MCLLFSCGCIMQLTLGGAPSPEDNEAEGQTNPSCDEGEDETRNMTGAM